MSRSTAKKKKWFVDKCKNGCQICGSRFPGRNNNGLVIGHIIENGSDSDINCLALCPNCEKSFDIILKPILFKAIKEINDGKIPESWEHLGNPTLRK